MIAKIAVSAANFAIDKPYSYRIPEGMELQPGQRVQLPFGRGNRRCEGIVLAVEPVEEAGLKAVERCLDDDPILTDRQLRLAAFLRERYFCTYYDAVRAMLPAGLWFQSKQTFGLTENRAWKEKTIKKEGARKILEFLEDLGGEATESALRERIPEEEILSDAVSYLVKKKWLTARTDFLQRTSDKTEKIATLAGSPEEAMEYASHRPKSASMQRSVLELLCSVGSVVITDTEYGYELSFAGGDLDQILESINDEESK